MTLIRKDLIKGNCKDNFLPITLLNTELKILIKVLAKRLLHVADGLIEEAQTCAIPSRNI